MVTKNFKLPQRERFLATAEFARLGRTLAEAERDGAHAVAVAAASGSSLFLIAILLGHSQMSTTQRYAHLTEYPLRVAAASTSSEIAAALFGQ